MLAPNPRRRRARFRSHAFFVSTAVILSLVAFHRLFPGVIGASSTLGAASPATEFVAPLGHHRRRTTTTTSLDDAVDVECRLVHQAKDKCAFVRANCADDDAGLLPYLTFYYCTLQHVQPLAFGILVVWLGLLFTTIGIAASDFFSVNLGTIASILGLSESLAGVTFLAFGNGSPDVFSTFAAMDSNSGSMAVGELIGAAGFITGVVAGSMALVREFKVSRRTFVRDILFFIAAVAFAMVFLADGRLQLWECCVMIGFYVFYVFTVVGWHWVATRRKRRRAREAASRGHFYGTATTGAMGSGHDEDLAPYHDDERLDAAGRSGSTAGGSGIGGDGGHEEPDETAPVGGRRKRQPPTDISALERGPRIEIDSVESPELRSDAAHPSLENGPYFGDHHGAPPPPLEDEEEEDRRNRHITAEVTSSMRVHRPRGQRSSTALSAIRPSLLGALEFRSVLASLQRSGTMHLAPIDRRRLASHRRPSLSRGYSVSILPGAAQQDDAMSRSAVLPHGGYERGAAMRNALSHQSAARRDRALSSGDMPLRPDDHQLIASAPGAIPTVEGQAEGAGAAAPGSETHTSPAGTAPGSPGHATPSSLLLPSPAAQHPPRLLPSSGGLHLDIPSASSLQHGSGRQPHSSSPGSSPALSPFPGYSESPLPLTPAGLSRSSSLRVPPPTDRHRDGSESYPGLEGDNGDVPPKPVRWWPYSVLPPPHVLTRTVFPSLTGWKEKTIWDKFVSVISVPTVFLLVLTLPVVETEARDDEDEDEVADAALEEEERREAALAAALEERGDGGGGDGSRVPLINALDGGDDAAAQPGASEAEWQRRYRRSSASLSRELPPSVLRAIQQQQQQQQQDGTPHLSSTAVSLHSAASGASLPGVEEVDAHHYGPHLHPHLSHEREHVPVVPTALPEPPAKPTDPPGIATDAADATGWNRWLVALQLFAGPLFTVFIVWANMAEDLERPGRALLQMVLWSLLASCVMLVVLLATTSADRRPKYHSLLCFLGFVISVAWISTVAGEVVGVLKAFGVIVGISEAILGLTIFAVGNSLGDLVADITVARLGYPVMALSACFGGPMLNILLGVGIGGAWMTVKAADDRRKHQPPGSPPRYEPYAIEVGSTLLVSAVTVLVTLLVLLVAVPCSRWTMTRRIGLALIGLWTVSTVVNVVLEVTGAWDME